MVVKGVNFAKRVEFVPKLLARLASSPTNVFTCTHTEVGHDVDSVPQLKNFELQRGPEARVVVLRG